MNELTLPTVEESTLTVSIADKTIKIDVFDVQVRMWQAGDEAKKIQDPAQWRNIFIENFYKDHGVVLSLTAATLLQDQAIEMLEVLKKKSLKLEDSSDSTESVASPQEN